MARIVGWVSIAGFALYGFRRFVGDHVVLDNKEAEVSRNRNPSWRAEP